MYHEDTRPSLLLRVRDVRDQEAWRELEAAYGELILLYCRRRGLKAADCEDVRQLVWMNLARCLRNFEYDPTRGRFRDYLGRVVRNAISRHFARPSPASRTLDTGMLATLPDGDSGSADPAWEEEWVNQHYRRALAKIECAFEPRSVEVFRRLAAGDSVAQVAGDFAMSTPAIHKVKHRIKKRMQELIARQIQDEDDPKRFQQNGSTAG